MRVLCVTPWFPNSPDDGRYNFILHSVRALETAGHQLHVLVTRPFIPRVAATLNVHWSHAGESPRFDQSRSGMPIEVRRYFSIPRYMFSAYADGLYRLGVAGRLRQLIRERRIDVVHAHTERTGIAAVSIARECGVPSVVTLHGISTAPQLLDTSAKRERLRECLTGAARVVLVGEPLRRYFAPLADGDSNFRVVPNGFFVHGVTRTPRPADGALRLVSVSNLEEGKGIDLNLRALARLDAAGLSRWTYAIVGDGADRQMLQSLSRELKIHDRVTFHGALAHDAAMQVLAANDVFSLPSYREAFGVAYLEAMACGLLTIGVEGQGPSAFISHGHTGLLVQPHDADALLHALKLAIESPDVASRIAAAGQARVRQNFTWDRHAEKLSVVYDEAVIA